MSHNSLLILFLHWIGTKEACTECTELILVKLHEDANVAYQNKNTSYSRNFNMKHNGSMSQQQVSPAMRMALPQGAETTSETSTITINGICLTWFLPSGRLFFLTYEPSLLKQFLIPSLVLFLENEGLLLPKFRSWVVRRWWFHQGIWSLRYRIDCIHANDIESPNYYDAENHAKKLTKMMKLRFA